MVRLRVLQAKQFTNNLKMVTLALIECLIECITQGIG